VRVIKALQLTPQRDLLSLLACWSDIGTHGEHALYRQMFLNPTVLKQDPAFAANGYGEFLTDNTKKLVDHEEALRGAFSLTEDEFGRILTDPDFANHAEMTPDPKEIALTLVNISALYRRGWLARKLRLSVREPLLLMSLTKI